MRIQIFSKTDNEIWVTEIINKILETKHKIAMKMESALNSVACQLLSQ